MAAEQTVRTDSVDGEPAISRKTYVVSALIYPFWHLAAPAAASDPWWAWWLVGSSFLVVDLASRRLAFAERHVGTLLQLCSWLVTLQLYLLAYSNDMQPFYVVGSVMSVLATSVSVRSKPAHLAYAGFVMLLTGLLFSLEPDGRKAAYWGGMLTLIAASYYRLSAQLMASQLIREHQRRLEERVKERTFELSEANRRLRREMEERARLEDELRVAQKLEAVGRLAGGIAHEFNNLLTRIRLYAEFALAKSASDADLHHDVEEIQKAGRQAASLTRQLLTFSRRGETSTQVLDLNEVIETSSLMLRRLLGENTNLVCLLGHGPHCIRTDRGQLEQVLVNLALNARDAMAEGGRFGIETSLVRSKDAGKYGIQEPSPEAGYVLLAVSDTGTGMDPETRARAFDPFFTRKPVDQGTGLGLSIVYGILKQAGGHVRVQSEPGKGARFELLWPHSEELPTAAAEPPPGRRAFRRGNERILLVEDEAELREALKRLLAGIGYEVLDAPNPRVALAISRETAGPIHLLLTDVVMPGMNGVELAEAICATRRETRVLLISGHMDLGEPLVRALPPGVGFVAKPFDSEDLAAKVREVLDATTAHGAAPVASDRVPEQAPES